MRATISILTYSAVGYARDCVESVLEHTTNFELLLTSNGSDRTTELFRSFQDTRWKVIRVIENATNQGFIAPNRFALEITTTPLFVMLNDDTRVGPGWLDKIREEFDKHPKAALVGAKARCTSLTRDMRGTPGPRLEYLEGSCLACKTEVVKKLGLFSPELKFAYGEDSDLSLRCREAGYTIHQADFTLPFHACAATTRTVPGIGRLANENHEYLKKRWAEYLNTPDRKFPCER